MQGTMQDTMQENNSHYKGANPEPRIKGRSCRPFPLSARPGQQPTECRGPGHNNKGQTNQWQDARVFHLLGGKWTWQNLLHWFPASRDLVSLDVAAGRTVWWPTHRRSDSTGRVKATPQAFCPPPPPKKIFMFYYLASLVFNRDLQGLVRLGYQQSWTKIEGPVYKSRHKRKGKQNILNKMSFYFLSKLLLASHRSH